MPVLGKKNDAKNLPSVWNLLCHKRPSYVHVYGYSTGFVVKIENMIIQSHLRWYGHVIHWDINSQICEVMELQITGKWKKGWPRKSWEECIKKDLEQYGLRRKDAYDQEKWQEQIKAKIATSQDNGIKTDVVVVTVVTTFSF